MKIELGDSWAVKRPDAHKGNDDWERLIFYINKNRPAHWGEYKGDADHYYGIDKNGFGFSSQYKSDFEKIAKLSEATEFILSTSGYIGAHGTELDDFDIKAPRYEMGDITKL